MDSCLYRDFHNYIDAIRINKDYFKKEDLKDLTCLKSLYSREEPRITIHDYIDRIMKKYIQGRLSYRWNNNKCYSTIKKGRKIFNN